MDGFAGIQPDHETIDVSGPSTLTTLAAGHCDVLASSPMLSIHGQPMEKIPDFRSLARRISQRLFW